MITDYEQSDAVFDTLSSIPERFRWAKFSAVELRERVKPMSAIDAARVTGFGTVVLTGAAGLGKTCLGCALLLRFARMLGRSGHFADAIDLAYARRTHPLGAGEAPEVLTAMRAGVLFLDELGAEHGADQTIEQIIRTRHNRAKPTIYATAHSAQSLITRYGEGVGRRVFEGSSVIELGGPERAMTDEPTRLVPRRPPPIEAPPVSTDEQRARAEAAVQQLAGGLKAGGT